MAVTVGLVGSEVDCLGLVPGDAAETGVKKGRTRRRPGEFAEY